MNKQFYVNLTHICSIGTRPKEPNTEYAYTTITTNNGWWSRMRGKGPITHQGFINVYHFHEIDYILDPLELNEVLKSEYSYVEGEVMYYKPYVILNMAGSEPTISFETAEKMQAWVDNVILANPNIILV